MKLNIYNKKKQQQQVKENPIALSHLLSNFPCRVVPTTSCWLVLRQRGSSTSLRLLGALRCKSRMSLAAMTVQLREREEWSAPPAPTQTVLVSLGAGSWWSLCQWSSWDSLFLLQAMGIQASSRQSSMAVLKITALETSKVKEKTT